MKTYADAHNHLNGVLSVDAIKIMMSAAKEEWDNCKFGYIPDVLIPKAKNLSFSNTSVTNDYGWIDCLDIISRLIVFTFNDIKQGSNNHNSVLYHNVVKNMLIIEGGTTKGRGMNCAGLLLAGCIGLRCLLDYSYDDPLQYKTHIHDTDRFFIYLQSIKEQKISFGDLFLIACTICPDVGLTQDNWLFNKFQLENLNPLLQACAEQIAISCVTSALSTSMWAPFDDNYAIRGLLTKGDVNKSNYIMLTFRWLLEKEALRGNYFSEITIFLGELAEIYNIIKSNAINFGFKEIKTGGEEDSDYFFPIVLENDKAKRTDLVHNNKLYLRFLTGCLNYETVRSDVDINKIIEQQLEKINQDQKFGCWAGIDMFSVENFVYDSANFTIWLTNMYNILCEINKKNNGKRKLWLRPHVGEGCWSEDFSIRHNTFDGRPLSLAKKLKSLSDFFKNNNLNKISISTLNQVVEFIYRSIFTGWLPIDDIRAFYNDKVFSTIEFQRLSSTLQLKDPSRGSIGERIGTANLETMINWINNIRPNTVEEYDENCPQVRFGHGSHLGFDAVWSVLSDLHSGSFTPIWVDLNLGSNVVTAAKSFNSMMTNVQLNERLTNSASIEVAIKEIIDHSRFTCGYIQTEIVERSERIAKFIDLLKKQGILFILGTDGQGSELTSILNEHLHFHKLMYWYYKDNNQADFMNKTLKANINEYIKYALGGIKHANI